MNTGLQIHTIKSAKIVVFSIYITFCWDCTIDIYILEYFDWNYFIV